MIRPELLAPAGDLERLKIAILYGADAVYLGGVEFGLRANTTNFTYDELKEGVVFAHSYNKKVYVTVNIVLHNKEIINLVDYLKKLEELNVDAIIVSDPAIIKLARENTNLEIHLSTQQSTLNIESVKFFKNEGVTRIVLARETSRETIKNIKDNVDIELECFVQGAMCSSFSGRCVLSNYLTARDSNRGGCSQICRWDFDLKGDEQYLVGDKPFTFCTKDLSMLKYIPDMIDLGISSFKIEGRMRSIYYIATVVSIYRKVIDEYLNNKEKYVYNEEYEKIIRNCSNRDSIPQFYNGINDETCGYYNGREEISNQDFLGIVLDYDENKKEVLIEQRNYFKKGDIVEFFGPNMEPFTYKVDKIIDENEEMIEIVRHPRQIIKLPISNKLGKFTMMRKKREFLVDKNNKV